MGLTYADDRGPDTIPTDYGSLAQPQAAHAASEFDDERQREQSDVSPFFRGLFIALGLAAACLIVAHLIAGVIR